MKKAAVLVPLLILGWSWTLHGAPVLSDPLYPTQENFDLARFLGTWHDVAVATSKTDMHFPRGDTGIGNLTLQKGTTEDKINVTRLNVLSNGTCHKITVDYEVTTTPGRFFCHVAKWGANVDVYVVHTNYDEYAIVIMNKEKSGITWNTVKLFSRNMAVRDTVLEDFKILVKQQGMSEDTIIIKQKKGGCVSGNVVAEPEAQPEPQRIKRAVPSLAPVDVEGSGDDTPLFNGTEACRAKPDPGPCFGLLQRYFYNSSSMSCQLFQYGGCLGNMNNFENERDCLQRCRTEAVCRLPMVATPCTGQPSIWAFDSAAGLCVPYKVGFCQGNANKFYSKAECNEYCGVALIDDGE